MEISLNLKPITSFFFFFIVIHLWPCLSEDGFHLFKDCGGSYSCGELVNITYPFWGNKKSEFCGQKQFKLNCKNNRTTTIQINSVEHYVLQVNQWNTTMRIARSDLFHNYCSQKEIKVATLDHYFLEYDNLNISLRYNCSAENKAHIPETYEFRCSSEAEKQGRVNYAFEPSVAATWIPQLKGCEKSIQVVVTREGLKEGLRNRTGLVEMAVKRGFEVVYDNLYAMMCEECYGSGGICGGNETLPYFCICRNGVSNSYYCEPPEWFFSCNNTLNCESLIGLKEFPLWRFTGKESCWYPEAMKLSCNASKAAIEVMGAKYQLLGFDYYYPILIIGNIGFSDQYCRQGIRDLSYIYGIIPQSLFLHQAQRPEKNRCSRSVHNHMPNVTDIADGDRMLNAVVQISPTLSNKLGGLQEASKHFVSTFGSDSQLDAQACRSCSASGGICGFEDSNNFNQMFFHQPNCFFQSSSYGFQDFLSSESVVGRREPSPSKSGKLHLQKKTSIIVAIVLGSIIMIICIVMFLHYIRKNNSNNHKIDESIWRYSTHTPRQFSYSKLKKLTNSFKNKLGRGGFSTVYKGKLSDGREVAVKLLNESKGNSQDFINEVVSVTKTAHVNIAPLLGFCYDGDKRALIYEYMPNGSLDKYIFHKGQQNNEMELDWKTLYNIVMGVARGLEYLHRDCNTKIVHFDIKPHNILLDSKFCPKISDFGLAKQCKESHVSMTGVKGTAGFMAPEMMFRSVGKVSHKSDVYSFGMLVLEIVGQRKSPNEGSKEQYFPDWIYDDLGRREGQWWGRTEEEEEMVRKMIIVGLCCIQTSPDERPPMSEVVAMLEASVDGLQIPPKPTALFTPPAITFHPLPSSSSSSTSY